MNDKIFSVKTIKKPNDFSQKVITILGIKITFVSPKIEDVFECIEKRLTKARAINKNFLYLIYSFLKETSDKNLFCLRNNVVCFIFNNHILNWNFHDFCEYIMNNVGSDGYILDFENLPEDSALYKEHIKRLYNNEFLWKYLDRGNIIRHTFLSFDENNSVYINEAVLDDSFSKQSNQNEYFKIENSKRLYISGKSVKECLKNKTFKEKEQLLKNLIDHIFETYSTDNNMIDGIMLDCNCSNFVIDDNNKFHFIDKDYVSKEPIDKEYVIRYVLKDTKDEKLKLNILKHYNYLYTIDNIATEQHNNYEELKNKYFIDL